MLASLVKVAEHSFVGGSAATHVTARVLIALRAVTIYRPETQTNKLKLTLANSSPLSDFFH